MGSSIQAKMFIMAALLGLLFLASPTHEVMTCNTVVQDMKPCIPFLQNGGAFPPADCCAGAKALSGAATTTPDKQTACGCLKSASKNMKINAQAAQALPKKCGINLPYTFSPSFDCSTIR